MKSFKFMFIIILFLLILITKSNPASAIENWPNSPLLEKIRTYKDVSEAFERRASRTHILNPLIRQGAVGETHQGFLLTRYENIPEQERALLEAENRDRIIIMQSIARANLELEGKPVNYENMTLYLPGAINYFCSLREACLPKGAWIVNEEGQWIQKQ